MKTKNKLIGAGIGLAALAAAGTYFLHGKRGARNRETIAGWALEVKGRVLGKMAKLKDINQESYNELITEAVERFARVKNVSASELKLITADLKSAWSHIHKQLK